MRVAVIANEFQKQELLAQGINTDLEVGWLQEIIAIENAGCYIDLLFTATNERIELLKQLPASLIIINEVAATAKELPKNFVRINGWPGFLQRSVAEVSCNDATIKKIAEEVFYSFNKTTAWVPDTTGFISARVVSMIINEAYLALEEGVSTKEEIDIAMKLGTNYPYGPFEWANKIGIKKVYDLLYTLAQKRIQYEPATLIKKEALAQ